jgi:hypothetical protein
LDHDDKNIFFFTAAVFNCKHVLKPDKHKDILKYKQKVVEQKMNYFNPNPINSKWNLADEPQDYKYSSARFYYTGKDEFGFLENGGVE